MAQDPKGITVKALVIEALANAHFRLLFDKAVLPEGTQMTETDEGPSAIGYLAGKMRLHRIRVLVGDQVEMVLDPYGGRARIVRRLT